MFLKYGILLEDMIEVILPTLNEEKGLSVVINKFKKQGIKNFIVIDGHSTDRTVEIAKDHGSKIIMQEGKGKGMAFQTFLKKYPIKNDDLYVMLDADNSYDPDDVSRFIEELKNYDVVTGHRITVRYNPRDFIHYIGNKIICLSGFILFFRWNPDICTGYWGFRGSALKKIKIDAKGFDLEANLYTQIIKKGLRHKIIKIVYSKRIGEAKLRVSDAVLIIKRLISERKRG